MTSTTWLEDIILVNDGPDETCPGDVAVFRNLTDASAYLEHWSDSIDDAVFSGTGQRLIMAADEHGNVNIQARIDHADGEAIIKAWLTRMAEATLEARKYHAARRWGWGRVNLGEREAQGVLPATVEGLIAYVGFTT
ncbi:hypothetical protein [Sphingomonas ursincola]|uniref:hypothetical protein n=1 Tax=Sphingomonas ursincola TaxID=56361 RepID=UPI0023560EF4|nr:hypothetical protein [Sphingomonas ursincola]MBY0619826.1 hypothetical protein [Sphingomonas ursincola]